MATTSNNPNARYDAGPNAAGCGRVATQEQLQAQAETGLLGDSTLSGAPFRVGLNAAGIRNVNTGGNIAGAPLAPSVASASVVEFSYEPDTAVVTWTDTNGAGQSGDLATFAATADFPTVSSIDLSYQGITAITVGNQLPALVSLNLYYNNLTSIDLSFSDALTLLDLSYNPIASLDTSNLTHLEHLELFHASNVSTIDISQMSQLNICSLAYTSIATVDASGLTNLVLLDCGYNGSLTAVTLTGCVALATIYLNECAIVDTDSILSSVNGFGTSNGQLWLDGGSNAIPTGGAANADKVALQGRGWTVNVNT